MLDVVSGIDMHGLYEYISLAVLFFNYMSPILLMTNSQISFPCTNLYAITSCFMQFCNDKSTNTISMHKYLCDNELFYAVLQ